MVIWTSWGLLLGIVNVVIVWYGGHLNLRGRASIGDIMAFQWYTFLLLTPVWNIVNSFSELQRSLAAMERVFELLAMEADKPDKPDAIDAPRVVHELDFEHVEFEYREDGRSSRLQRAGARRIGRRAGRTQRRRQDDGHRSRRALSRSDRRAASCSTASTFATSASRRYRDLLAIVQQDVFLFDGSVRDNIAYGRFDATDAEVDDAARRANALEFIEKLPGRIRDDDRRARRQAVGRPAAAAGDRARDPRHPADSHSRRSDQQSRHGERAAHPGSRWRRCSPAARRS